MPFGRCPSPIWCMRSGFSLVELVLVLALLTLLLGLALPPLAGALDRIEVAAAASHIAAAHSRARMMAISGSRVLVLTVDSASLSIHPRGQQPTCGPTEDPHFRGYHFEALPVPSPSRRRDFRSGSPTPRFT